MDCFPFEGFASLFFLLREISEPLDLRESLFLFSANRVFAMGLCCLRSFKVGEPLNFFPAQRSLNGMVGQTISFRGLQLGCSCFSLDSKVFGFSESISFQVESALQLQLFCFDILSCSVFDC
mgnify:CR=1 FL=1